jgi:hypothetical protein
MLTSLLVNGWHVTPLNYNKWPHGDDYIITFTVVSIFIFYLTDIAV